MSKIIPTIGRRIWYFPVSADTGIMQIDRDQPCDAGIVFVHPDGLVNLVVTDHFGFVTRAESVRIFDEDESGVTNTGYAQWMPYQVKADAGRKEHALKAAGESIHTQVAAYSAGQISDGGMDPRPSVVFDVAKYQERKARGDALNTPQETNRVLPETIERLKARVQYIVDFAEQSTSTFVHAYLDGKFFLGSGHSACIDPANFSAEIGHKLAQSNVMKLVEQRLWELEGYALYKSINS